MFYSAATKANQMKRFRLWLAIKILGGHIALDDLIDETYAHIWPKHPLDEPKTRLELRLALTRAFAEGSERSGLMPPIKDSPEE